MAGESEYTKPLKNLIEVKWRLTSRAWRLWRNLKIVKPGLPMNNEPMYRTFSSAHVISVSRDWSQYVGAVEHLRLIRRHNAKPHVGCCTMSISCFLPFVRNLLFQRYRHVLSVFRTACLCSVQKLQAYQMST